MVGKEKIPTQRPLALSGTPRPTRKVLTVAAPALAGFGSPEIDAAEEMQMRQDAAVAAEAMGAERRDTVVEVLTPEKLQETQAVGED